jgi:hypothetical protein
MPDGGISPVRFEVLTFLHRPFPLRQGSSAGSQTPCLRGLPTASSPGQRPATAPVLASRPPTLTWKPPSTQSPFAHRRCYLPWGDVVRLLRRHYSPFPAHTDSCAKPCWLSLPSFFTRSESLCRLLPAPAASGFFPTLSLQIFPQMPGPLPRRSHRVLVPVSSPVSSAFPKTLWVGFPFRSANATFRGLVFEDADISLCSGL